MDEQLRQCIDRLNTQNEVLAHIREAYLLQESSRKHFEAGLISAAPSTCKSHVDRLNHAQNLRVYLEFHQKLAKLEATFKFEELKFSILEKEYMAVYLGAKTDSATIERQEQTNRSW